MVRRRSRLAKPLQEALIVRFVVGVPARTAAELVGINRNSATLFYLKLREVIADKLAELPPISTAMWRSTRAISLAIERESAGAERLARSRFSGCSSAVVWSMP
jgi:transposase